MALQVVVERSAGLDIGKASLIGCVQVPDERGGWRVSKRKFGTTVTELLSLLDWLQGWGVTRVGMESTGAYWKPVVRHEALGNRAGVKGLRRWPVAAGW